MRISAFAFCFLLDILILESSLRQEIIISFLEICYLKWESSKPCWWIQALPTVKGKITLVSSWSRVILNIMLVFFLLFCFVFKAMDTLEEMYMQICEQLHIFINGHLAQCLQWWLLTSGQIGKWISPLHN